MLFILNTYYILLNCYFTKWKLDANNKGNEIVNNTINIIIRESIILDHRVELTVFFTVYFCFPNIPSSTTISTDKPIPVSLRVGFFLSTQEGAFFPRWAQLSPLRFFLEDLRHI